jgi:hypothetical protein
LPCTGEERMIFDSLVSDFNHSTHDVEIRDEISQRKLNCALFVKSPKQFGVLLVLEEIPGLTFL